MGLQLTSRKRRHFWFYERIFRRLPFLPTEDPALATVLFFLILEFIALSLSYYTGAALISMLIGTLVVFTIALWTIIASIIPERVYSLRIREKKAPQSLVIEKYKTLVISPKKFELIIGIGIFSSLIFYYVYTDWTFLKKWWMGSTHWIVYLFSVLLTWEISYRVAISLWTSFLAVWRNFSIYRISKEYYEVPAYEVSPLRSILEFKRLDKLNVFFALNALPLYLVCSVDLVLKNLMMAYIAAIFFLYILSYGFYRRAKFLPRSIDRLLASTSMGVAGFVDTRPISPHVAPVAFTHDYFNIYFITSVASKKLSMIRRNPRACFLVDSGRENLRLRESVLIKGKAEILDFWEAFSLGTTMLRIYWRFSKKYPRYKEEYEKKKRELPVAWRLTPFKSRVVIRVSMDRMIYWRLFEKVQ